MFTYFQHGRRHNLEGSDAIAQQRPWALYHGLGTTNVLNSNILYVGVDGWSWGPQDQDAFGLGPGTGILTGLDGPKMLKDGAYKAKVLFWVSGTSGDEFEGDFPSFGSGWFSANTQGYPADRVKLGQTSGGYPVEYIEFDIFFILGGPLLPSGPAAPDTVIPRITRFNANAFTCEGMHILIERMSATYDSVGLSAP